MKLIDKDKVVAEIERIRTYYENLQMIKQVYNSHIDNCNDLLDFLDTLEVKQVDLDESARHYLLHEHISPLNEVLHHADLKVEMQYHKDIEDAYKAGFELGLKTKKEE